MARQEREVDVGEGGLTAFLLGAVSLLALTFYLGVSVGREGGARGGPAAPAVTPLAVGGEGAQRPGASGSPRRRALPPGFIGPPRPERGAPGAGGRRSG
jgi:hypothetical protein